MPESVKSKGQCEDLSLHDATLIAQGVVALYQLPGGSLKYVPFSDALVEKAYRVWHAAGCPRNGNLVTTPLCKVDSNATP